jgi:hypothetical protein
MSAGDGAEVVYCSFIAGFDAEDLKKGSGISAGFYCTIGINLVYRIYGTIYVYRWWRDFNIYSTNGRWGGTLLP